MNQLTLLKQIKNHLISKKAEEINLKLDTDEAEYKLIGDPRFQKIVRSNSKLSEKVVELELLVDEWSNTAVKLKEDLNKNLKAGARQFYNDIIMAAVNEEQLPVELSNLKTHNMSGIVNQSFDKKLAAKVTQILIENKATEIGWKIDGGEFELVSRDPQYEEIINSETTIREYIKMLNNLVNQWGIDTKRNYIGGNEDARI